MPAPLRPEFHEGQILAADDLSAVVRYDRDAAARHHRHLHTWGIASGLEVTVRARAARTSTRQSSSAAAPSSTRRGGRSWCPRRWNSPHPTRGS